MSFDMTFIVYDIPLLIIVIFICIYIVFHKIGDD